MGFFKWFYKDSAEHHGIKGQKWGVRRYQNYDGSRIKSSEAEYHRYRTGQKKTYTKEDKYRTGMSMYLSRAENSRTAHVQRSDRPGEIWEMENGQYTVANISPRSFDQSLNKVNERRNQFLPSDPDYNNNCVNVAVSMINQKKGFGTAAGPNADGVDNHAIGYYFDGAQREEVAHDQVYRTLMQKEPGSYGVMGTKTGFGVGHETVWEVNDDWSVSVYDGQNSTKYRDFKDYEQKVGITSWDGTSIYDLTNATPNFSHQAEDHAFYPSESSNGVNINTSWGTRDNYSGQSYDDPYQQDSAASQQPKKKGLFGRLF